MMRNRNLLIPDRFQIDLPPLAISQLPFSLVENRLVCISLRVAKIDGSLNGSALAHTGVDGFCSSLKAIFRGPHLDE